ncbi:hypothetical protein HT031_004648 [Scenedesmus sp. PABB004]|nr:hypothetical protein HT031_004648 [Scenedesmus sp. PABB004]
MPYKIPQSKVRQRMAKEVAAKRHQLSLLQQERGALVYQHALLAQCCDLLHWLRLQHAGCGGGQAEPPPLAANERELLAQLDSLPAAPACSSSFLSTGSAGDTAAAAPAPAAREASAEGACADAGEPRPAQAGLRRSSSANSASSTATGGGSALAGAGAAGAQDEQQGQAQQGQREQDQQGQQQQDQQQQERPPSPPPGGGAPSVHDAVCEADMGTGLLRTLLTRPLCADEAGRSLRELQDDYATMVCELSLALALHDSPAHVAASCCAESPGDALRRLLMRHWGTMTSLLLAGRHDTLMAFYVSNCLTGEVVEASQLDTIAAAVSQVDITPAQAQRIADGFALFKRLLVPLVQDRQQLQTRGFTQAAAETSARAAPPAPGGGGGGELADCFPARTSALKKQQRKVTSLSTLLKKELFLKACLSGWVSANLTWLQSARLMVAIFPYPAAMSAVAQELTERVERQRAADAAAAASAASAAAAAAAGAAGAAASGKSRRARGRK